MDLKIKKILIADDDDGIIDMLCLWIESKKIFEGAVVQVVKTCEEAEDYAVKEVPELIFLDLGLGNGLSGLNLLKDLRTNHANQAKIFVFSGYIEYEKECLASGATAFIKKGTKLKEIENIIQNSFSKPDNNIQ